MASTKSQNKNSASKYCKFCAGAGEPVQVYTSHYQFNNPVNGELTCPKLLAYMCTNCNSKGHIEKRCPAPKQQKENPNKFCRFCYNAHKSEYLTHNQFNSDGFVQCPALLEIVCQECGASGHTKKYCPDSTVTSNTVAATNKTDSEEAVRPCLTAKPNKVGPNKVGPNKVGPNKVGPNKVGPNKKNTTNKFSILPVVEEEEVDILQSQDMNTFPTLSQPAGPSTRTASSSTSQMWSKVVSNKPPSKAGNTTQTSAEQVTSRPPPPSRPPPRLASTISSDIHASPSGIVDSSPPLTQAEPLTHVEPLTQVEPRKFVPTPISMCWGDEFD